jgi:diaminopimelate decarboxylase
MTIPEGIFPDDARITALGHLAIGEHDLVELAFRYGTPLYVYDEATIRARARAFRAALGGYPAKTTVYYAAKAYCAPWILRIVAEEGLGLDVVSGGELAAAVRVDFPRERIFFHGNDKTDDELAMAVHERVGRVVIDNLEEIDRLAEAAHTAGVRQRVLVRVNPAVAPHTHEHLQTGAADSKFGLSLGSGAAETAIARISERDSLDFRGLHAHIGSQIDEVAPYRDEVDRLFGLAQRLHARGIAVRELSPGGGYGVRYTESDAAIDAPGMAAAVAGLVRESARSFGFAAPPDLGIEPGRAIVAPAAVALYRVGSVKEVPGIRTYVAVDGGMADNIRPTAYGATYTAVLADRADEDADATVAIAGRYCESGDVLIRSVRLPLPVPGNLVAIPAAGAYHLSMASNYNMVPRPAVVLIASAGARLVRRRETYDDLFAADLV